MLNIWSTRADAAMITTEVPWDSLYSGVSVEVFVRNNYVELVNFYRSKGMALWVYIDPQNGLERTTEASALTKRGLSIADPDVQILYRRFVVVMDSLLRPEHLGLALETNLIRDAAPISCYNGIKTATNAVAAELRARKSGARLSISIQAENAWGRFGNGSFNGVEKDFQDFPFTEELGISSYPYLGYDSPLAIPADYYQRILSGRKMPVFISEGGWASATFIKPDGQRFATDAYSQAAYYRKQAALLGTVNAIGWLQLSFTDIDLSALPVGVSPNIQYFSSLGLLDIDLQAKPSLAVWDSIYKR